MSVGLATNYGLNFPSKQAKLIKNSLLAVARSSEVEARDGARCYSQAFFAILSFAKESMKMAV
jgi:hypothetical protein